MVIKRQKLQEALTRSQMFNRLYTLMGDKPAVETFVLRKVKQMGLADELVNKVKNSEEGKEMASKGWSMELEDVLDVALRSYINTNDLRAIYDAVTARFGKDAIGGTRGWRTFKAPIASVVKIDEIDETDSGEARFYVTDKAGVSYIIDIARSEF